MAATILQGDVFEKLPEIKPGSVDVVCTSPPYHMLRSYLPKGHPLKHLELGSEPTVEEYVANMVKVFSLVRDCLSDHGAVWCNVGDSYQDGNLALVPWRLALALQDDGWLVRSIVSWVKPAPMPASISGWRWVRCRVKVRSLRENVSVGKKGAQNGTQHKSMPGSGPFLPSAEWSDCPGCAKCSPHGGFVLRRGSWRPTSAWEPILMLAKSSRYFCDGDAVKTQPSATTVSRYQYPIRGHAPAEAYGVEKLTGNMAAGGDMTPDDPSGANLRDVWKVPLEEMSREDLIGFIQSMDTGDMTDVLRISAEPLKEKHYAAFPSRLVEYCLRAGTSAKGYCAACGSPWCRVVEQTFRPHQLSNNHAKYPVGGEGRYQDQAANRHRDGHQPGINETTTLGWRPTCKCNHSEPRSGLVLDPFCGSGRTGLEAFRLGLDFVGIDLNPSYCELSRRLLREQAPLFAGDTNDRG